MPEMDEQVDDLHEEVKELQTKLAAAEHGLEEANRKVDHLLQHCKDYECSVCSEIVCKHHEPLHFHHDGCPACILEHTPEKIGKAWLMDSSLERWFPITAERLAAAEKELVESLSIRRELNVEITKLKSELEQKEKVCGAFREALKTLYEENADYIRINHLGDVHHNLSMQFARNVLSSDAGQGWHSPAEWEQVQKECRRYREALERLAKLGNEPALGNSTGNRIAQEALVKGQQ